MSEKMQAYIDEAESVLLHTYNRYQIVLDHGKGVYVYDMEGMELVDFDYCIGVFSLGYGYYDYNHE